MTRILLVEDDPRLAELLVELLRSEGHEVATEDDGARAVDRIVAEQPDVVVLDVGLPTVDGFTVCQQVQGRYGGRVLILDLLAHSEEWVREKLQHRHLGFAEGQLENLLAGAGFREVLVQRVARDPHPPHFMTVIATGRQANEG